MDKVQLDNLIRFCFLFNQQLNGFDASYILEKWEKYIGVKPKEGEFNHNQWVIFRKTWGEENYNSVKEILNFISLIGTKGRDHWNPDELVDIFEKNIGSTSLINKKLGPCIHKLVEIRMDQWISKFKREYNLLILDV